MKTVSWGKEAYQFKFFRDDKNEEVLQAVLE